MSIITNEMLAAIGVESDARIYRVDPSAIRRFAEAVGDKNIVYELEHIAPPTFLRYFDEVPPFLEFPMPYTNILDGGSDWEFYEPVHAGDEITSTTEVTKIFEKTGALGHMIFVVHKHRYTRSDSVQIAQQLSTTIYYNEGPQKEK